MNIALHDADKTGFPNLALMKLSAWHKKQGHLVGWFIPFYKYDKIYSSKVLTWTEDLYLNSNAEKGGTGYKLFNELPEEIEHICPDYHLYNTTNSYGFLTRGCIRNCKWCIVPKKEGNIRAHADINEFLKYDSAILLDNNILACEHGIKQLEKIANLKIKIDINQGLDARLIDKNIAKLLSKIKWLHPIRLACDHKNQTKNIQKAVTLLRWYNVTPRHYHVYVMISEDIKEAIDRIMFLKGLDLYPFVQPFRDFDNEIKITEEQKNFARWVNHKAVFRSVLWKDYKHTVTT